MQQLSGITHFCACPKQRPGFPKSYATVVFYVQWFKASGDFFVFFILMELFDHHCQKKFEDTKRIIRIHQSKNDRQHNGQKDKEELKDTKGVIRIHKSKDRQTTLWPKGQRRVERYQRGNQNP